MNNISKYYFSLVILFFAFCGCSFYQIDSHETATDYFPPKKFFQDVAYLETVDKPNQEIGIVTVTTERRQSMDEILEKIKQEAAVLGGDAVTDLQTDATGTWKKIKPQKLLANAYIRANFTAKVIVYK